MGSVDSTMHKLMFCPPPINQHLFSNIHNDPIFTIGNAKSGDMRINYMKTLNNNCTKWILFSHGNAGDISNYYEYAKYLHQELGVGCIFYDYPGYGYSNGTPTELSCIASLEIMVAYMMNKMNIDPKNIILVGQSIGTGITIAYAYNNVWTTPIILISPYKSIISVISDTMASTSSWFDKYTTIDCVGKMKCPIKIFHGMNDMVIPASHGKEIADNMKNKLFDPTFISNVGHNDILESIDNIELLRIINYDSK